MPTDAEPVTIVQGDCLDVLRTLPDGCVDAVVTDPPYMLDIAHGNKGCFEDSYKKLTSQPLQAIADSFNIDWFFPELRRLCDPVSCFMFCSNSQIPEIMGAAKKQSISATLLAWHKYNSVPFSFGTWRQDAEWSIHMKTKGAPLNGNADIKSKIKRLPLVSEQRHPTEKPLSLIRDYVLIGSNAGDLILDPFAGSGTTGVAAVLEGRRCILIEKDPGYVEICRRRVAEALGTPITLADGTRAGVNLFAGMN